MFRFKDVDPCLVFNDEIKLSPSGLKISFSLFRKISFSSGVYGGVSLKITICFIMQIFCYI